MKKKRACPNFLATLMCLFAPLPTVAQFVDQQEGGVPTLSDEMFGVKYCYVNENISFGSVLHIFKPDPEKPILTLVEFEGTKKTSTNYIIVETSDETIIHDIAEKKPSYRITSSDGEIYGIGLKYNCKFQTSSEVSP